MITLAAINVTNAVTGGILCVGILAFIAYRVFVVERNRHK